MSLLGHLNLLLYIAAYEGLSLRIAPAITQVAYFRRWSDSCHGAKVGTERP